MLRYLELRVTDRHSFVPVCVLDSKCVLIFFCFFEVHHIFVLLARARVPLLWCEEHTFAHSETFKKSTPFALKKIRWYERSTNAHEQQKRSSRAAFQRVTLFTHSSSTSPSLYSVYLYTQMIAIQRTSASLVGATTGARSSPATSRKNHRAAAASTVTRRDGMRSHVTSMERRTKNSFRLPAIAMPSPEVNERMQTMTYNETGKWRENFDLAGWAKEIREVRFSSLEFKRRPFPPVVIRMWIVFVLKALSSALSSIAASFHRF